MAYNRNLPVGREGSVGSWTSGASFAEELIKSAWENRRLASCYLFLGPTGTGRLFMARRLAKAVNCEARSFPPCLACSSCQKIENNNYPDVHYIQKEDSNFIKIEQIHQMRSSISLRPFEGKCKVFIILNAEDLTEEASNCLLKIIEEPPANSLLILIASDLRRILATIISRCQKIRFFPLGRQEAETVLNRDYHLEQSLSHWLAFAFEGRLGEALRLKDNELLNEKNQIIRYFIRGSGLAESLYGSIDRDKLSWILKILISCVRDLYLLKIGTDDRELINQDARDELFNLSQKFSFADLDCMLQQLCDWLYNVKQNINPRLLIDNLRSLWKK